jgi:uncharacterized membrane protein
MKKKANVKKEKVKTLFEKFEQSKIKLKVVFFVFLGVWSLDFISTFIALNFSNGKLIEANPFQAQFFVLGWYGWILSFIITAFILFLLTLVIGWGGKLVKKAEDKEDDFKYHNFFLAYCCGIFTSFEFTVIISNIKLILGL